MLAVEGCHASLELGAIVGMGEIPLESPVNPDVCPGCVGVLRGLLRVPAQAPLSPLEVIPVLHVGHNPVDGTLLEDVVSGPQL